MTTALSMDGGGVRGLITARVLTEIETRTGRPVSGLFDLIVGSSMGGLLSMTLAMPGSSGTPAFTAAEATVALERALARAFHQSAWRRLPAVGFVVALLRPK